MSDTARREYWFAVKKIGWGWGWPVCWQGWTVLFGYLGLVIAGVAWLVPQAGPLALASYVLGLTAILIAVVAWKGERPVGWR